jgi:hypothetical protein
MPYKQQPTGFKRGGYIMKDKLVSTCKSGDGKDKTTYNVTIVCSGMTPEQAQEDALHYYKWKLQRVIRAATDAQRAEWAKTGINLHYTEVGKVVKSVEQTVESLSDEQARKAYEMLAAKFGKKAK